MYAHHKFTSIADVPGAVRDEKIETKSPSGTWIQHNFYNASGELVRVDQALMVSPMALSSFVGKAEAK